MKHILTLMLLLTLLVPIGLVSADDPAPGSKEDNACYEGGSMAGKCDTPWEWVCGYYLARWISNGGWSTPNNPFNNACVSLLPPRPASEDTAFEGGIICIPNALPPLDLSYPSFNGVAEYVRVYLHTGGGPVPCGGAIFGGIPVGSGFPAFYGTPAEAAIACPITQATVPMNSFFGIASLPANLYFCS